MGDVVTYILESETLITVGRKKIVSHAQTCGPLQRIKPPVNSSNVTSQHLQTNKLSHVHSGHAMACSVETNVLNGGCKPGQNLGELAQLSLKYQTTVLKPGILEKITCSNEFVFIHVFL